jgi:hypothetical protein
MMEAEFTFQNRRRVFMVGIEIRHDSTAGPPYQVAYRSDDGQIFELALDRYDVVHDRAVYRVMRGVQ